MVYNYSTFVLADEEPAFGAFRNHLHVGERAPDFVLEDLETGSRVALSEAWRDGLSVVEFGSFT